MVKGKKNDGVASAIRQTPGAIGYTEYGFAKLSRLPTACLENKAGKFVCPGPEGGAAALANAVLPENMIVFVNDPEGDASYPIATFTWMLFYKRIRAQSWPQRFAAWLSIASMKDRKLLTKPAISPFLKVL